MDFPFLQGVHSFHSKLWPWSWKPNLQSKCLHLFVHEKSMVKIKIRRRKAIGLRSKQSRSRSDQHGQRSTVDQSQLLIFLYSLFCNVVVFVQLNMALVIPCN